MKKLLLIILPLFSFQAFSQNKSAVGIELTPYYAYRFFTSANNENIMNKYHVDDSYFHNIRDSVEKPRIGFSAGLKYDLKIKKVILSTGIQYLRLGEIEKRIYPTGHIETVSGYQMIVYDGEKEFSLIYTYNYLCAPIKISYLVVDGPLSISAGIGGSVNYLLSQKSFTKENTDQLVFAPIYKNMYTQNRTFVLGFSANINVSKKLNDKLFAFVSPTCYLQITPGLTIENELMQHNYGLGLSLGIMRKL